MLAAAHEGAPDRAAELELQRVEQGGEGEPATMYTEADEAEGARLVDGVSSSGEARADDDLRRVRFTDERWGAVAVPNWWAGLRSIHRRRLIAFVLLSSLGYFLVAMAMVVSYRRRHAGLIEMIAFGSCTAYHQIPQPVWAAGVIPSRPDAWVWMGDLAYMDDPNVNCEVLPSHPQCNCTADWLHTPPHGCSAGDLDHATKRMEAQLTHVDYAHMLEYMCPGYLAAGNFPPDGSDSHVCPRPVLGTYDDHDFTWNNGNGRLPQKQLAKQVFLDALGVPADSPRRLWGRGIEWQHTLNAHRPEAAVDVFLLDGRYHRDPLPCEMRRHYCEMLILPLFEHGPHALGLDVNNLTTQQADALSRYEEQARRKGPWCVDFLRGGELAQGSCCAKDETMRRWCDAPGTRAAHAALWQEACNASAPQFGLRSLVLKGVEGSAEWSPQPPDGTEATDMGEESPFCEVLGYQQRVWLERALAASTAPLKLIVSGSVLLGSAVTDRVCDDAEALLGRGHALPGCMCSGDDWDCYGAAQRNLVAMLARTTGPRRDDGGGGNTGGCAVVLTGDYHWSDIKVAHPGEQPYAAQYGTQGLSYPLYQVMASGLTNETGKNWTCESYRRDPHGLRDHAECAFLRGPSFGTLQVDWAARRVLLQSRRGHADATLGGELGLDPSRLVGGSVALQSVIDLDTCQPLPS